MRPVVHMGPGLPELLEGPWAKGGKQEGRPVAEDPEHFRQGRCRIVEPLEEEITEHEVHA